MSIPGTKMTINGLNLNVLVEGAGEPVLLLHGFPDSNYHWRGVIPNLVTAGYKVIAPDQRGFGESDAPEGRDNPNASPWTSPRPRWYYSWPCPRSRYW